MHSVDEESVAGIDDFFVAQIKHDEITMHSRTTIDLHLKGVVVLFVQFDPLDNIRQRQDFFDRVIAAIVD